MSRDGGGVYSLPAGYLATTGQTATAAQHNSPLEDLEADMNIVRPVVAGGTGGATEDAARVALEIDGKVQSKAATYTVLGTDRSTTIRCTASLTLDLTAAATLGDGFFFHVIADTGTTTIDPNGAETIDGAATLALTVGQKALIICDGSNFHTLNELTAVEMAQLQNIGAVTISNGQWTYLGAMNQGVATTDTVSFADLTATTADINGGTIDATAIGGTTPAAGDFAALTSTSGAINGTVGATTPAAGDFTTISASGVADFADGTALLPSITNTGDLNTGMWFPAADTIAWSEGGAEAMRLDANSKLLVGTTNDLAYNAGVRVRPQSIVATTTSATSTDYLAYLNRQSSDGQAIAFGKANSVVGRIDVSASGMSLFLGGIAAANELSDYEEGTWTPVLSDGTNSDATQTKESGTYTKVGNIVHVHGRLATSALGTISGDLRITGLPFTSHSITYVVSSIAAGFGTNLAITAGVSVSGYVGVSATHITLTKWSGASGIVNLADTEWSADGDLAFTVSYTAA